jgi:hypothetical protein
VIIRAHHIRNRLRERRRHASPQNRTIDSANDGQRHVNTVDSATAGHPETRAHVEAAEGALIGESNRKKNAYLPSNAIGCKRTPTIWIVTTLIVVPTVTNCKHTVSILDSNHDRQSHTMIKAVKDAILCGRRIVKRSTFQRI